MTLTLGVGIRACESRICCAILASKNNSAARCTIRGTCHTWWGTSSLQIRSSPLRHAYGGIRDFCLGMEFVTGEGTPAKSGGRVVKIKTGYDLHKLLIGSLLAPSP